MCAGCGDRRQRDGTIWYLVKWRDLPYDQATWEREDNDIVDMKQFIENYENLRYCTLHIGVQHADQSFHYQEVGVGREN